VWAECSTKRFAVSTYLCTCCCVDEEDSLENLEVVSELLMFGLSVVDYYFYNNFVRSEGRICKT
jgi:hypothetical protein